MDPATMMAISAGSQALGGVVQLGKSIFGNKKANEIIKSTRRPVYKTPKPVEDNQQLVESRAGQGLSDASRQVYQQNAERVATAGIDAILKGGGSVNNIADLYSAVDNGIDKLALIDDDMRARNVAAMIAQNERLAAEKDKEFQINEWAPYADKMQAAGTLKQQASNNFSRGLNTILGAGANYMTAQQFLNEQQNVFGNGAPARSAPAQVTPAARVQQAYPGLTAGYMPTYAPTEPQSDYEALGIK